jgi:translation elongation factor EF-Tu-like GTPase
MFRRGRIDAIPFSVKPDVDLPRVAYIIHDERGGNIHSFFTIFMTVHILRRFSEF